MEDENSTDKVSPDEKASKENPAQLSNVTEEDPNSSNPESNLSNGPEQHDLEMSTVSSTLINYTENEKRAKFEEGKTVDTSSKHQDVLAFPGSSSMEVDEHSINYEKPSKQVSRTWFSSDVKFFSNPEWFMQFRNDQDFPPATRTKSASSIQAKTKKFNNENQATSSTTDLFKKPQVSPSATFGCLRSDQHKQNSSKQEKNTTTTNWMSINKIQKVKLMKTPNVSDCKTSTDTDGTNEKPSVEVVPHTDQAVIEKQRQVSTTVVLRQVQLLDEPSGPTSSLPAEGKPRLTKPESTIMETFSTNGQSEPNRNREAAKRKLQDEPELSDPESTKKRVVPFQFQNTAELSQTESNEKTQTYSASKSLVESRVQSQEERFITSIDQHTTSTSMQDYQGPDHNSSDLGQVLTRRGNPDENEQELEADEGRLGDARWMCYIL